MRKIIFATNNVHKLAEARQILGPKFELTTPADHGITEDIPEKEATLLGNALAKARYVHERTGLDCFADDTGLEVTALKGAPGVHSARYAEMAAAAAASGEGASASASASTPTAAASAAVPTSAPAQGVLHPAPPALSGHDAAANMALLLKNMEGVEDRRAKFHTVVALVLGGREHTFDGEVRGHIAAAPAGTGGFGYDPVFIPEGYSETFAQMSAAEKNAMSHRARAIQRLAAYLKKH